MPATMTAMDRDSIPLYRHHSNSIAPTTQLYVQNLKVASYEQDGRH